MQRFSKKELNLFGTRVVGHLRQQAYLVKGLTIHVIDARGYEDKIELEGGTVYE
jgi:hypothetical protein